MTHPPRRRTGAPAEPDAFFGRTHQLSGATQARHTPLQPMRVPGHAPLGGEERGHRHGSGRRCAHAHRPQGPDSHGTGRETASVNPCERTAGIVRPHAFHGRHRDQEPKLFLAAAGTGIDRSAWEQALISSGCRGRGRAQRAVRRERAGATAWAPR